MILLYSGNIGQKQGLERVVEAAQWMRCRGPFILRQAQHEWPTAHFNGFFEDQPRYLFVMCGDGMARKRLQTMAKGLENILWLPLQPIERLNERLNLAAIHLLRQSADAADLVMPSKLTGMLASARPVIATTAAAGTQVAEAGCVVLPGDITTFVNAIKKLAEDEALRTRLGHAGRAWIETEWDMERVLTAFEDELKLLAGHYRVPT